MIVPVNESSSFISRGRLNYKQVMQSFVPARLIFFERNVLAIAYLRHKASGKIVIHLSPKESAKVIPLGSN